jgi:hypothetical protein
LNDMNAICVACWLIIHDDSLRQSRFSLVKFALMT